jgi:hypothetical protein
MHDEAATAEAKLGLSDVMRCGSLAVITGLGTLLCVHQALANGPKAPAMAELWQQLS